MREKVVMLDEGEGGDTLWYTACSTSGDLPLSYETLWQLYRCCMAVNV